MDKAWLAIVYNSTFCSAVLHFTDAVLGCVPPDLLLCFLANKHTKARLTELFAHQAVKIDLNFDSDIFSLIFLKPYEKHMQPSLGTRSEAESWIHSSFLKIFENSNQSCSHFTSEIISKWKCRFKTISTF